MSGTRGWSSMAERKISLQRKALKARKRAKAKKPEFARSESWRYLKLKKSWRKPRGLDHKMRRKIKGWPPTVSVGYKGPKVARGLHPSGYWEVLVHNVQEVSGVDPKTQAARIAHTVGKRKRAQIVAAAREREVVILNVKEVKALVEEEAELEEAEEKPVEEQKKPEEKAEKPKKGRKKVKQEAQELPLKKAGKQKKSKKAAETGEDAEE
jgi:large subunit ribosomal protein L32e